MNTYLVKDQSGRVWKSFKDEAKANQYVREMNAILVGNSLGVEFVRVN